MDFSAEMIEAAKGAVDRQDMKQKLIEKGYSLSEGDISDLAWKLGIPHGNNCPCCNAFLWRVTAAASAAKGNGGGAQRYERK